MVYLIANGSYLSNNGLNPMTYLPRTVVYMESNLSENK